MSSFADFLSDRDWRNLLREIHSGQVVPFIDQPERFQDYNQVASEFLPHGGERKELYLELCELLERLSNLSSPSEEGLDLALINVPYDSRCACH